MAVIRVALDTPLRQLFDYLPPPNARAEALAGRRVRVPFGRRRLIGVTMGHAAQTDVPTEKLKAAIEVLDERPILDAGAIALLTWAAEYYHHPIGEVLAAALPKALREGAPARPRVEIWSATEEGRAAASRGALARAPRQRELMDLLARGPLDAEALAGSAPSWRDAARALVAKGWIAAQNVERPVREAHPPADTARGTPPMLSAEQAAAVEAVGASFGRFAPFLLHGITGSGKTEVYLQLVQRALAAGRCALVLVPEIGLTPQLLGRFRDRLEVSIALLHSALTDQERLAAWREASSGEARVVVGTRSAVFAPLPDLGIVVVDEEHDPSYKQHEGGFRYSARDLAVMRARESGVPIVLGSATPSFETLHNVTAGRYAQLTLPRRAAQARPPAATLVDLRRHAVKNGLSTPAVLAMQRHLADGQQVLVFLNRRGYAPTLLCTTCGWIAPCDECDAHLTVHQGANRLRCHHCGAESAIPAACRRCGFPVKPVGQGTERIEETLASQFPDAPVARLDRDVVQRRGDAEAVMQRMVSGEARILVGTQMVTKGHDFPSITLVLVLNADQGLFSTDFRAPERLAQIIVQVAGRAGRGDRAGEVLIQTDYPEHPLLTSLLAEGYEGFARTALAERAESQWPPFSRLAALRASSPSAEATFAFLDEARRVAGRAPGVKILGPAPAAMARRAGRHHAQLLLESRERPPLHRFIGSWLPDVEALKSARRVRWVLDVDPLELF